MSRLPLVIGLLLASVATACESPTSPPPPTTTTTTGKSETASPGTTGFAGVYRPTSPGPIGAISFRGPGYALMPQGCSAEGCSDFGSYVVDTAQGSLELTSAKTQAKQTFALHIVSTKPLSTNGQTAPRSLHPDFLPGLPLAPVVAPPILPGPYGYPYGGYGYGYGYGTGATAGDLLAGGMIDLLAAVITAAVIGDQAMQALSDLPPPYSAAAAADAFCGQGPPLGDPRRAVVSAYYAACPGVCDEGIPEQNPPPGLVDGYFDACPIDCSLGPPGGPFPAVQTAYFVRCPLGFATPS
jgi:hypothetical protein